MARLTANPALHLFVQTLTDLTQRQQAGPGPQPALAGGDPRGAHQIAEAIIARDGALARHRMMTHLEDVAAAAARRPLARAPLAEPTAAGPVTAAG